MMWLLSVATCPVVVTAHGGEKTKISNRLGCVRQSLRRPFRCRSMRINGRGSGEVILASFMCLRRRSRGGGGGSGGVTTAFFFF